MIYLLSWEELLRTIVTAGVPAAMAFVAWRNRVTRPIAARLFIIAAICQCAPLGIRLVEQLLGVSYLFEIWQTPEADGMDLTIALGDELRPGSPGWQRMFAWQIALSVFHLLAWSLMAWAILRQPDGRLKTQLTPAYDSL